MSDLLNTYIFHWEPSKAIWIGGHTLSWDARCSGIYIGFAVGVLCQVAINRKSYKSLPSNLFIVNALLFLPLFFDVFTVRYGLRVASNDMRYLTGLLFGEAFSAFLYPAFITLTNAEADGKRQQYSLKEFVLPFFFIVYMFFLKEWNNLLAFGILELTGIGGFLSLFGILVIGISKAFASISPQKIV